MKNKLIISVLFLTSLMVYPNLPPTSSKVSGEGAFSTTFNTDYGNIPATRNGSTITIGTIPVSAGGTGSSSSLSNGKAIFSDSGIMTESLVAIDISGNVSASSLTLTDSNYATMNIGKELTLLQSTGSLEGGFLTVDSDPAKFDMSALKGYIVNSSVNNAPTKVYADCPAKDAQTVTNLGTQLITYVLIDASCTITQQSTFPTPAQRRAKIFLGRLNHSNLTSISFADSIADFLQSPMSQYFDLVDAIAPFSYEGNIITANGANLSIDKSAGKMYNASFNYASDNQSPNNITNIAKTASTFRYATQTTQAGSSVTVLDPTNYDVGGTITAVGGTTARATVQRVYLFPSNNITIQYGQEFYANLADAIANYNHESFVENTIVKGVAVPIAYIAIQRGCTSLLNTACSHIIIAPKFGGSTGAAGAATTNLQQAYNNSSSPQITTDATLGSFDVATGLTLDGNNAFTVRNNAGTVNFSVTGNGNVSGKAVDSFFPIQDASDPTKQITFDAAGTTGTLTTLVSSQTANRLITLPDLTTTLVGTTGTQTISDKTFVAPILGAATATSINSTTIPTSKTLVVTTDKLSALSSTTSSELAGVISDETGSGKLVFDTSPTLVTPIFSGIATGNISGNAATVTTIPTLSGEVTNTGNAITLSNASVIGKVLTGFTSGAGTVTSSDTILSSLQKINGNVAAAAGLQLLTAVASTSGTTIDFTIPTSAKRINIMFSGVSGNGTSSFQVQMATGGSVVTTGYISGASNKNVDNTSTSGFLYTPVQAVNAFTGKMTLSLTNSSTNLWTSSGVSARDADGFGSVCGGYKALSGLIDRVRITTVNGTDTFDAGTVNVSWEY